MTFDTTELAAVSNSDLFHMCACFICLEDCHLGFINFPTVINHLKIDNAILPFCSVSLSVHKKKKTLKISVTCVCMRLYDIHFCFTRPKVKCINSSVELFLNG